jgi:hypothetical protein
MPARDALIAIARRRARIASTVRDAREPSRSIATGRMTTRLARATGFDARSMHG